MVTFNSFDTSCPKLQRSEAWGAPLTVSVHPEIYVEVKLCLSALFRVPLVCLVLRSRQGIIHSALLTRPQRRESWVPVMHLSTCIHWVSLMCQALDPGSPSPSHKPLRAASSFIHRAKALETWQWLESVSPFRRVVFRPEGASELPGGLMKHTCRAHSWSF